MEGFVHAFGGRTEVVVYVGGCEEQLEEDDCEVGGGSVGGQGLAAGAA